MKRRDRLPIHSRATPRVHIRVAFGSAVGPSALSLRGPSCSSLALPSFGWQRCVLALAFFFLALLLPPRAQAAILSIAPRDGSYDDQFHDRAEWKQWTQEENRHYQEQHVLMWFQGEAYRKPYADAMARWMYGAPPPPTYLAGYRETTFWRERPYRLRTARNPQAATGIPVRGLSSDAALGFVSDFRAILGVTTAPQHVYVVRRWQSGLHSFRWYFRQFLPGQSGPRAGHASSR